MASNVKNIIAAIAAGGGAGSFAFFAPAGTPAPTATTGTAGVQTLSETGTPTGGTFSLSWNGFTTAPIAYNAAASAVASALNTAAGLTGGSAITASGGPLPTSVALTFPARIRQTPVTVAANALTGGTTPTVTVAQTTAGTQSVTAAFAVPGAGWYDCGWCDTKGVDIKSNLTTTDIKGMGSFAILRTITTEQKKTFDVGFLETTPTTVAIYNSLALGSVAADSSGSFTVATGTPSAVTYAAYFVTTDGANGSSFYMPNVQITNQGDLSVGQGGVIDRPVTATLYPDTSGNVVYESYTIANLGS